MAGYRIDRINEEITRVLADLIRCLKDPRISGLVSITRVDTARDLGCARVYISVLGSKEEEKATVEGLKSAAGFLRRELGAKIDLRKTPELRFIADTSLTEGSRILEVMNELERNSETHD